MADPNDRRTDGAPPTHIHIEPAEKKTNWLAWLALAAGLIALLFALSRCDRNDTAAVAPVVANDTAAAPDNATDVVAATPNAPAADALAGTSGVGAFLAGTEGTPRTFTFEKLNFDTAKSAVRPADAAEVNEIAATLKQYGNARVRIAGYADARGPAPANVALGKARAESIKAALVAQGIDAGRVDTVSGGESDPVDTNATATGQAENRRTELVVLSR